TISRQLSSEMPGLRGFSSRNLRNMRMFYEQWEHLDSNWLLCKFLGDLSV
ncbi:MAG: hypothetical protein II037_05475, partial [Bacteroidales bacterium]|nr:hypothetical protein [Bacteroidales bacterium]